MSFKHRVSMIFAQKILYLGGRRVNFVHLLTSILQLERF